jgi:hypothetical protein
MVECKVYVSQLTAGSAHPVRDLKPLRINMFAFRAVAFTVMTPLAFSMWLSMLQRNILIPVLKLEASRSSKAFISTY